MQRNPAAGGAQKRTPAAGPRLLAIDGDKLFEPVRLQDVSGIFQGISATNAKVNFGTLIDHSRENPVVVMKGGRAVGVMISPAEFIGLRNASDALVLKGAIEAEAAGYVGEERTMKLFENIKREAAAAAKGEE